MLIKSVRAELVEALLFFFSDVAEERAALRQAQGERIMVTR
jgi:hypothetical protein